MVIDAEGVQDIEQRGEEGEELEGNGASRSAQCKHRAATPPSREASSLGIVRTSSNCNLGLPWLQSYSPPSVSWDLGHAELSPILICLCALAIPTAMLITLLREPCL